MKTIGLFLLMVFATTTLTFGQNEAAPKSANDEIYITKRVKGTMDEVYEKVVNSLKDEKFGVVTEVNMSKILKEKIDVDIDPYMILGVCNPGSAYLALQAEPNIGVFLPCKVILKQVDESTVEVTAANPNEMMKILENEKLDKIASHVTEKLKVVIRNL